MHKTFDLIYISFYPSTCKYLIKSNLKQKLATPLPKHLSQKPGKSTAINLTLMLIMFSISKKPCASFMLYTTHYTVYFCCFIGM